ncbi:glycosyltransferase [Methylocella sp.]|uniref:glycosyltransferase n=1 Tax=Methylocella sp. TaxID=1978226 RepID=UPI0037846A89
MKISFLDPGLLGKGEHSYSLIRQVGEALTRRGVGWRVFAPRAARPEVLAELGATAHFRRSLYESVGASSNEWRLRRALAFLAMRRFDPDAPTEHASARLLNREFREDFLALPADARETCLVVLPAVSQHQLPGLVEALLATPPERRPRVLCQLMFAPDWTPWGRKGRLAPKIYARAFRRARALTGKCLFFSAENVEIARSYREAYGVEAAILPVPFGDVAPARAVPARPVFGFFGYSKCDKGFHLLPEALDLCRAKKLEADFVVQVQHGGWEPATIAAERRLRASGAARLLDGALSDADYAAETARVDAMLLPYDPALFGLRGSGVFTQSAAAGRPVVAAQGTFAAAAIARGEAEGEIFSPYDARSFAAAILRLAARLPSAHARASALAADFARAHGAEAYADVLLSFAGERPPAT